MTEKTQPTDAEIIALADETRTREPGREGYSLPISFTRADLAKRGTPDGEHTNAELQQMLDECYEVMEKCYFALGQHQKAIDNLIAERDALKAAHSGRPVAQEPFGYANTSTGQFFTDVELCRKNNEGHWRTVYIAPQPSPAAQGDAAKQLGWVYCYQGQEPAFSYTSQPPGIPKAHYWQVPVFDIGQAPAAQEVE